MLAPKGRMGPRRRLRREGRLRKKVSDAAGLHLGPRVAFKLGTRLAVWWPRRRSGVHVPDSYHTGSVNGIDKNRILNLGETSWVTHEVLSESPEVVEEGVDRENRRTWLSV
jgi:hypothetical protein